MGWVANQQFRRLKKKTRIWGVAFLCCMCFLLFTPRIPRSAKHHQYVDMRNLLGVPNTLNVITNFPFLVVGVLGFVFALEGGLFSTSSKAEAWAWILFYAGTAGMAFGSAYYHLKPDDNRVLWDTLPIMVAYSALLSSLLIERMGQRTGLCCMFLLLLAALLFVAYERIYNDIRFCMIFQLILPVAIPGVAFSYHSIYTHSSYWFWSTGIYLLAKFEAVADRKLYQLNNFTISGHSLEHLCLALIPVLLGVMLSCRNLKFPRLGELKDWP
ncbi:hypothetical protein L6164_015590 [Bauhinia variegata]|uniref:Uncharacterized protein n=1 Tax=Bauhinia variegata TaxID=167791 RepID=A0ACB9NPT0_BAUVA|nr:hypothetical protein L6164_015590 [Bauhinia variegata]